MAEEMIFFHSTTKNMRFSCLWLHFQPCINRIMVTHFAICIDFCVVCFYILRGKDIVYSEVHARTVITESHPAARSGIGVVEHTGKTIMGVGIDWCVEIAHTQHIPTAALLYILSDGIGLCGTDVIGILQLRNQ